MIWMKTLLFTIIAPGTLTVLLPYLLLAKPQIDFAYNSWHTLGAIPMLLGIGIYLWCARDFAVKGGGTPAPYDPPKQLVVHGLYRFVRNPMYVGIVLILIGEARFFSSTTLLFYTAIVFVGFHLRVLLYEEPTLQRLFGESFRQYCLTVHRWVPRLKSTHS